MNKQELYCNVRRKKYSKYNSYNPDHNETRKAPNILNRNFEAEKFSQKWVTDITEIKLFNKKYYLSPILDLHNREIISYTFHNRPTVKLVMDMLEDAIEKTENVENLILHSDQGFHYRSNEYIDRLKDVKIVQSMSRKGNCFDNAVIENFFGHLKCEFVYLEEFKSIEEFTIKLHEYMYWYNNKRTKSKLNGLSPIEFRTQSTNVA